MITHMCSSSLLTGESSEEQPGIKMNVTIHKQISDMLEGAGTTGMTLHVCCSIFFRSQGINCLQDITSALLQFDRRTVELILGRAEKVHPPAHLKDLTTVALMETSGRERRIRYYTLAAYRELMAKENLHDVTSALSSVDLSTAGEFCPMESSLFYDDLKVLKSHQDRFRAAYPGGGQTAKARKPKVNLKNPIMPDGTVKKGRPRKQTHDADGNVIVGPLPKTPRTKRKREEADDGNTDADARPKKRGRGKKQLAAEATSAATGGEVAPGVDMTAVEKPAKKRGKKGEVWVQA